MLSKCSHSARSLNFNLIVICVVCAISPQVGLIEFLILQHIGWEKDPHCKKCLDLGVKHHLQDQLVEAHTHPNAMRDLVNWKSKKQGFQEN